MRRVSDVAGAGGMPAIRTQCRCACCASCSLECRCASDCRQQCVAVWPGAGAIIIGGGVVKHHIMNANLMRNGCDHAILINTGQVTSSSVLFHLHCAAEAPL